MLGLNDLLIEIGAAWPMDGKRGLRQLLQLQEAPSEGKRISTLAPFTDVCWITYGGEAYFLVGGNSRCLPNSM